MTLAGSVPFDTPGEVDWATGASVVNSLHGSMLSGWLFANNAFGTTINPDFAPASVFEEGVAFEASQPNNAYPNLGVVFSVDGIINGQHTTEIAAEIPTEVPEPASCTLLALGGPGLLTGTMKRKLSR